jgi:tRNA A-37 threonylcarbamoyl transferase component Bud32
VNTAERYRLVRTVASGGMAQVMEAVAFGLDGFERRVAIKRLLPQHARDGERRRMFFEEARIGSRLHHGSIVPIFDYGLIDGSEFLAMEYVDGLDALRAVTGSSAGIDPMPEGIALHIAAEIAHALAYLHDLRDEDNLPLAIVHRDVSPPNILLSWNGDVKLSDFGIALARAREQPMALGGVQGKLHYMAPEQARGEPVSAAADIYALGATLEALLGGGALSPVSSEESGNARAAAALRRGLSLPVCALIHSCMTRDPRFRPTAADVAARAGVLASRLLGTDGRGALRGWLEPMRPRVQQSGALDDLMGLCLVPVERDGARTFTISRVWDASSGHTRPRAAGATRSRRPLFAVGAALAVGVIAAVLGMDIARRPSGSAAARAPMTTTAPAVANRHGGSALTSAHAAAIVAGDAQQTADHDTVKRGWLRVGGAALLGARVDADGAFAGFAPLEMTLPDGAHAIVVRSASGRVLVRKHLRISEQHTRLAPLRIIH